MENKKIRVVIDNSYILAFWLFGFLFTLGITLTSTNIPPWWEQILIVLIGLPLWPILLGVYFATVLGTF